MRLYVGNLSIDTSESRLRALFATYGHVTSASLAVDTKTGHSRGFGFVEFAEESQARAAMAAMNGQNVDGLDLMVIEALHAREAPPSGEGPVEGPDPAVSQKRAPDPGRRRGFDGVRGGGQGCEPDGNG